MNILLATPFQSTHHDAGLFWAAAFSRADHAVILWDYRREPHRLLPDSRDICLVLKGGFSAYHTNRSAPEYVYWPDALGRDPKGEATLASYDKVFTCLRPTPEGMIWLPTGWDPTVHYPRKAAKSLDLVFVGTATPRKAAFLSEISRLGIRDAGLFGNGWKYGEGPTEAIYLDDYCETLSRARISINVHRDGEWGVNRRLFESIACTFTLTDLVPGVEEILGAELAAWVGFKTPEEARRKVQAFLSRDASRIERLWMEEREAIKPYTYDAAVKRVLEEMES